ncbi:gamma-aminobutyric acid type B receptor subunit 1-like [Halichondria panicea]|uniref:gamma-aminobutyric acid type B receptor subunit 1-like n=1 Tax=Halichondria panicea TaxID=6063 RepID=UPI00312B90FD
MSKLDKCVNSAAVQTLLLVLLSVSVRSEVDPQVCNYTTPSSVKVCEVPICDNSEQKPILYFLVMGPYPRTPEDPGNQPSWRGGPAVIPGALLAAEHINCDSRILPDYHIKVIISDGGCNLTNIRALVNITTNIFLNQSNVSDGNVVGIIGGACSESTILVAELVARDSLSLVQIAPSATSPIFVQNQRDYSNTIRLTVNALLFVNVFKEIIVKNGYSDVAILYDSDRSYHISVANDFQTALGDVGIKAKSEAVSTTRLMEPLKELRNENRLIFVFAGRGISLKILCLAYNLDMVFPNYQIIFINRRMNNFIHNYTLINDPDTGKNIYNCSIDDMKAALPTATLFEPRVTRADQDTKTFSNYTYNEIECQYNKTLEDHKHFLCLPKVTDTEYQNAYYDSTWALAMSLHNAQPEVNLTGYKYGQPSNTKVILSKFFDLSFEGAFGKVQFNNRTYDTEDVAIVNIFQQRNFTGDSDNITSQVVAFYNSETKITTTEDTAIFINSSVFEKEEPKLMLPPKELGWTVIAFVIVIVIVIVVLHCLNGTVSDLKHVKATSPQLNHLIFSGCYLMLIGVLAYTYVSVFFDDGDELNRLWFSVACNIQAWVSNLAFSLIFGTICMKTLRIYRIFNHFSSSPIKGAGDSALIGFVVFLVLLDAAFLLTWAAIDPLHLFVQGTSSKVVMCNSTDIRPWIITLLLIKGILMICVLFLSIKTRKINKREFKQTKAINTFLYIQIFTLALGITPYAIINASQTVDLNSIIAAYVLYCGAYILATIFCVIFIFIPPIYPHVRRKWAAWTSYVE